MAPLKLFADRTGREALKCLITGAHLGVPLELGVAKDGSCEATVH